MLGDLFGIDEGLSLVEHLSDRFQTNLGDCVATLMCWCEDISTPRAKVLVNVGISCTLLVDHPLAGSADGFNVIGGKKR